MRAPIEVSLAQLSKDPGCIANAIAIQVRTARLKRLWRVEDWLMLRRQQYPRIRRWLHAELVAIGWRSDEHAHDPDMPPSAIRHC